MDSTETQLPVACNRREELFWRKVGPPNDRGCRLWTGVPDRKGYGASCFKGLSTAAHRVAFLLAFGLLPKDRVVMHECDEPLCCNPAHLRLGTQAENMADMWRKGRGKIQHLHFVGEAHGRAKVTDEQVRAIRAEYARGNRSQQAIADQYGISQSQIGRIVRGVNRANA